jgi:peptidyl-prolyl cis-trans isomerase C
MTIRGSWLLCGALVVVPWLSSCGGEAKPLDVVARVGNAVLTRDDLRAALPLGLATTDPQRAHDARRQLVEQWIQRELLYQEALDRDLDQQARLRDLIAAAERDLLAAALIDLEFGSRETQIDDSSIERYYTEHIADFQRAAGELRARHILLASQRDANARLQALQRGESFEALAGEHSLDPDTRFRGGDLGFFSEEMDPALWAACENLPLDKVSKPIHTVYGYHLFQVLEHEEPGTVRGLLQVRDQIIEALARQHQERQLDSLLTQLRRKHKWSIEAASVDSL